jgi:hypothetical protein
MFSVRCSYDPLSTILGRSAVGNIREVSMKKRLCFVLVASMAASVAVPAQEPSAAPANPISASENGFYTVVSGEVIAEP